MAGRGRYLVSTVALAALLVGLWGADRVVLRSKQRATAARLPAVPLRVGPWRGREIPVSAEDAASLRRSQALMRRYLRRREPATRAVDLAVVSAADPSAFHNPESCYRAAGWSILRKQEESIETGTAGRPLAAESLLVERGGHRLYVLYWYAVVDPVRGGIEEGYRSRVGVLLHAVQPGRRQPAAFFRLTTLAHDGEAHALARTTRFLQALAAAIRSDSHGKEGYPR